LRKIRAGRQHDLIKRLGRQPLDRVVIERSHGGLGHVGGSLRLELASAGKEMSRHPGPQLGLQPGMREIEAFVAERSLLDPLPNHTVSSEASRQALFSLISI
jgi:hypothetical protein